MLRRRVAVTGLGVVSALGPDCDSFWNAISNGRSGIRPLRCVEPGTLRFSNGAEVDGYDPEAHFEGKQLSYLDRFAQFGIVAAREALRDSGLTIQPERTAVITGSGRRTASTQFGVEPSGRVTQSTLSS